MVKNKNETAADMAEDVGLGSANRIYEADWPRISLGEVASVFTGFSFKGSEYLPEGAGIRVVRGDNVTEYSLRWAEKEKCWLSVTEDLKPYLLEVGDVVIGMDGSKVGKNFASVTDLDGECLLAQRVARIRAKKGLDQTFLRYLICNPLFTGYVQAVHTGTSIPHISKSQIEKFEVYFPPVFDQIVVGSTLQSLDNRIALLRETNATLEAIAQALFKSWFVDFDPVHAKQQGLEPKGMDADTAALFPDSFEESELGLAPKGWRFGILGDITETVKKQLPPSKLNANMCYVGLEHIPRQSLSLTNWGNPEGLESAKAAFSESDILFGKLRPYFHKVVIAPFDGVCSTDILVFQSKKTAYYGMVAMCLFSTALVDYASRLSNGAKMPRINWKDLAEYPICIPPEALAAEYSKTIKPLFERMAANVHQAQTLTTLRDTLLPRLISGQLRLPDAEAMLEETT